MQDIVQRMAMGYTAATPHGVKPGDQLSWPAPAGGAGGGVMVVVVVVVGGCGDGGGGL